MSLINCKGCRARFNPEYAWKRGYINGNDTSTEPDMIVTSRIKPGQYPVCGTINLEEEECLKQKIS